MILMPITLLCRICESGRRAVGNLLFRIAFPSRVSLYTRKGVADATPLFPQTRYFYRRDEEPLCLTSYVVVKRNNVAFLRHREGHICALSLVALDLSVSEINIDDERTGCSSGDLE